MPEKIFMKFMLTQQLLFYFFFLENSYIKFHRNVTIGLTTDLGTDSGLLSPHELKAH